MRGYRCFLEVVDPRLIAYLVTTKLRIRQQRYPRRRGLVVLILRAPPMELLPHVPASSASKTMKRRMSKLTEPTSESVISRRSSGTWPRFAPACLPQPPIVGGLEELCNEIINHRNGPGLRERLILPEPLGKYEELRMRLEEYPGRLRYDYDYGNQKIISFPDPSTVHESTTRFFREIMASTMNPSLARIDSGLVWEHWGSQTTTLTSNGRKSHAKGADVR